ncbi:hypothetical protein BMY_2160 [Wohlfahrtiimonas chitiniclastica]|nr:hypothetical protein BMY_2155 [Wohlfahrtiimonas chitiniclastica]KZS22148.1 hypothetical protein BMY_2160 [Wohlfahrtiimonas chitiniclastica]
MSFYLFTHLSNSEICSVKISLTVFLCLMAYSFNCVWRSSSKSKFTLTFFWVVISDKVFSLTCLLGRPADNISSSIFDTQIL